MIDEIVRFVFTFPQSILARARSSANRSTSTSLSSKFKSAIPATKASAPRTRTPDVGSKPSEASLALKLTANGSMGSRVGRCHDDEYDGRVVRLVNSFASLVGQEVEFTRIGHVVSNNEVSYNEQDHDNYGHAIHSMVSDAGGQEVEYSKGRESSHLLSPDNAEDPNLPDDKHHGAMKDAATPASLALKLTANGSMDRRVGRRHDEENDGNSGQGLKSILKVTSDKYINAIALRDSILVAEPSALPTTPTKSVSLLKMRDF
jgi:hypothetical protein